MVECVCLLNKYIGNCIVGSNPTLSSGVESSTRVSASALGAEGYRLKSCLSDIFLCSRIAQLAEHWTENPCAAVQFHLRAFLSEFIFFLLIYR